MTTTAYLDLFIRSVSEPALLHTFLSFILLHRHDNVHILDTLVSRINTPFQVPNIPSCLLKPHSKMYKKLFSLRYNRNLAVFLLGTLLFQLGTVSLALFRTLIGLYCEDVMLQLIFKWVDSRRVLIIVIQSFICSSANLGHHVWFPKQAQTVCCDMVISFYLSVTLWSIFLVTQ